MSLFLVNRRSICCCVPPGVSVVLGSGGGGGLVGGFALSGPPGVVIKGQFGGEGEGAGAAKKAGPAAVASDISRYLPPNAPIPVFVSFGALVPLTFGGRGDFASLTDARQAVFDWIARWQKEGWTGRIPYDIRDGRNNQIIESG